MSHSAVEALHIPIPPLAEQQRIVDILDRFDTLTTDITAGLPAEIEARRKQYEYNLVDYGRDLGVMFMGDLGDSGQGFKYFHYDLALTNGSIPCKDDRNKSKDIYASMTIRPIKNFNVKATVNWGEYSTQALAGGQGVGTGKYNSMTRFGAVNPAVRVPLHRGCPEIGRASCRERV